jgi:hypothetical protein
MTASKRRARYVLGLLLALTGLAGLLILPGLPSGRANTSASSGKLPEPGQKSTLDADRQSALEKLYAQFKAGSPFSAEETLILRKFGEGAPLSDLEADIVISRALYDFYLAGKDLTKEQEELFDRYSQFAAHLMSQTSKRRFITSA